MMNHTTHRFIAFLAALAAVFCTPRAMAQQFTVESFRLLENDVTAFVDPVNDLNDDGCALLKIQASPDFAFSTPLGIVKRSDKTGEIWLYVPKGTKKITIKHPEWGVMRDYPFPSKLESHMSYELKIKEPLVPHPADTSGSERITTVRDTLLLIQTDTLIIVPEKKRTPFSLHIMATGGINTHNGTPTAGIMLAAMRKAGAFIHLTSSLTPSKETKGICDAEGHVGSTLPWYSGKSSHHEMMAIGGMTQRLTKNITLFEGLGFGKHTTYWELSASEGGGNVKNAHLSEEGISFEIGAMVSLGRISSILSASSIKGKMWGVNIGVGIRIGKDTKRKDTK